MVKRISAKELLADDPKATNDIEVAQELLAKLREAGLDRPRYRLASPLTGRRRASFHKRPETHSHTRRH